MGLEREGSGGWGERGGKRGEMGMEVGIGYPPPCPPPRISKMAESVSKQILSSRSNHKLYRRSYMSAHDLLILFKRVVEKDKM